MKTEDFASMLARGAGPRVVRSAARRYIMPLGAGLIGTTVLMVLLLGVRRDLTADMGLPMFWMRLLFLGALAVAGFFAALRLATPGARVTAPVLVIVAALGAFWVIAAAVLVGTAPGQISGLLLGTTWRVCAFNIALLSVPSFAASLYAMAALAPTSLRLAGAAAGFVSGALAAVVYTLHCPEIAAPFVAVWYVLGILIPTAAGAMLGPRVLRW